MVEQRLVEQRPVQCPSCKTPAAEWKGPLLEGAYRCPNVAGCGVLVFVVRA